MTGFFRSLFSWGSEANARTVIGGQVSLDAKQAALVRESNNQLAALFNLCKKYMGTPYAARMRSVYEKTHTIHNYLTTKNRIQELALFHLQHTEHFINTFTIIWQVHQKQPSGNFSPPPTHAPLPPVPNGHSVKANKPAEPIPVQGRAYQQPSGEPDKWLAAAQSQVPRLTVTPIRIDTAARMLYKMVNQEGKEETREIGLTSPEEEKEKFLEYVATRFGLSQISYKGNALVNIPDSKAAKPTGLVAIIYWLGCSYALNLMDGRLFPVKLG
ncbi:MAG: hypothetical protein ACO1O1_07705 [Adhaeribacter sp.]